MPLAIPISELSRTSVFEQDSEEECPGRDNDRNQL